MHHKWCQLTAHNTMRNPSADRSIPASSSRRRPRFLHASTLRNASVVLQVLVSQLLPHLVPMFNFLLVGLVVVRVASSSGLTQLVLWNRVCPAASTWAADVDLLVHLNKLPVLPLRSFDAPSGWPDKLRASLRPRAVATICCSPQC